MLKDCPSGEPKYFIGQEVFEVWADDKKPRFRKTKIIAIFARNGKYCYVYESDAFFYIREDLVDDLENGPECTSCRFEIQTWHVESKVIASEKEAKAKAEELSDLAKKMSAAEKKGIVINLPRGIVKS